MINKNLKKIVMITALFAIACAWIWYFYQKNTVSRNIESFLNQYDAVEQFEELWTTPLVYKALLKDGSKAFLVFEKEIGYQSEVVIATLVSSEGNILNVRTLRHGESPPFYNKLADNDFFSGFNGKPIARGVKIDTNVDGISGATLSAKAATKAVHRGITFVGRQYLDTNVTDLYTDIKFGTAELAVLLMLTLALAAYKFKNKKFRYLILLYSVIIMGFHFSLFLSYSYFFTLLTGNWPSFAEDLKRYMLLGGVVGLIMLKGRNFYCLYMCPFGALQELQNRFAKLPGMDVSASLRKYATLLAPLLAFLALFSALITDHASASNYEPFPLIFGRTGVDVQWVLLPVTLLMAFFSMRFYCRTGCPVGYVLNLMVRIRSKAVNRWKSKISR